MQPGDLDRGGVLTEPRKRRGWRWLAVGLGALLLLIVIAVGAAYLYLSSDAGGARVKRAVLEGLRPAIRGQVAIGQVKLSGTSVTLHDVVLRTEEGERVGSIATVHARIRLGGLLRHEIDLEQVTLDRPELDLVEDARGLNLARAVMPRQVKAATPGQPGTLTFRVGALAIEDGRVELRQPGKTPERIAVTGLSAKGSGVLGPGARPSFAAHLVLDGRVSSPTEGPLHLVADLRGKDGHTEARVETQLAGLALQARAELAGSSRIDLQLARLRVDPETALAFLPSWPLAAPVSVEGEYHRRAALDSADLSATAAGAKVHLEGTLDLARLRAKALHLAAENIDLQALTGKGPPTRIALTLDADGGGTGIGNLEGKLALRVPPSTVNGRAVGPVTIDAHAAAGELHLDKAQLRLPGLSVDAAGTASQQSVDISGTLTAKDLALLSETFAGIAGASLPPIAGGGQLAFTLRGATSHPGLATNGRFAHLHLGQNHLDAMSVRAALPDVKRPLEANATLRIGRLELSGRELKNVSLDLSSQGRKLHVDARMQGLAEVLLRVDGLLDPDGQGAALSQLVLRYPEEQWTLASPTHLRFTSSALEIAPLELRSGRQSISLSLTKRGPRIDGRARLVAFDVARLPAFISKPLGLGGIVDLDATVNGRLPWPEAKVHLTLEGGRLKKLGAVSAALDGTYLRDHAVGTLHFEALTAKADAHFDLPVQRLFSRRALPVSAQIEVPAFDVGRALCALEAVAPTLCRNGRPRIGGQLGFRLSASGEANAPDITLALDAEKLRYRRLPPVTAHLAAHTEPRAVAATLAIQALDGGGNVSLAIDRPLAELFNGRLDAAHLRALPVRIDAALANLSLAPLHESGWLTADARGTVGLTAKLAGPLAAPIGTLTVTGQGLTDGKMPAVELALDGELARTATRATLRAQQDGTGLADLSFALDRGLEGLLQRGRLASAPFRLSGTLGPVALERYPLFIGPERRPDQKLHGQISGKLTGSGTTGAPTFALGLELTQFGVGKNSLGGAEVSLGYDRAVATLRAALQSKGGGQLQLTGESRLDLSLPALQAGLNPRAAPVQASLHASRFDLGFLTGLSPVLKRVAGTLTADGTLTGTLGAPKGNGRVELKDGGLALAGYGAYDGIHLLLSATNDHVELTDLSMKSGGGSGKLVASADRQGNRWVLTGNGRFDNFPIVNEDQLLATASLRSTFDGEITPALVDIRQLRIPEAHFVLPSVKRKDLQSLDRPDDIVLTRNGRPVEKAQRRNPEVRAALSQLDGTPLRPVATPAGAATGRRYQITVTAPRNVWLKGEDLNAEIGLSPGFRVELADTVEIFGQVRILRARLDALGRRFDAKSDSEVRFTGPAATPYVNVTAVYKNEPAQVTVFLTVRGQGKQVRLNVNSDPPLSESEIYTLLATGRLNLKRGSGSAISGGEAASVVGSLVASQLKSTLTSNLPLDVISIEAGESGLAGSKLEAGTYVTDKIYVGYTGRIGADPSKGENSNAVKLEYQISPHWNLEAEYGDARAGGADLIWSKDY